MKDYFGSYRQADGHAQNAFLICTYNAKTYYNVCHFCARNGAEVKGLLGGASDGSSIPFTPMMKLDPTLTRSLMVIDSPTEEKRKNSLWF